MTYDLTPVTDVRCPVCGSSSGNRLYRVTSAEAAQHFCRAEVDRDDYESTRKEIERLWGRDHAQVVKCDECGFCAESKRSRPR